MMRCEVPDYDTPVLVHGYNGVADNDDDSVDSCLNAFMAIGSVQAPPSDTNPFAGCTGLNLNFYRGQGL